MALKFNNATSDRVVLSTGLNNLNTYTVLMWIKRTADITFRSAWSKGGGNVTPVRKFFDSWSSVDQIAFRGSKRTTTNAEAISNTGEFPLNTWKMYACTYDSSDGPRIFGGTLTAEAAEIGYASRTAGSGTEEDDSDNPWLIGQGDNIDLNGAWPGDIAIFAHFVRRLTVSEIVRWQFAPYTDADCDIFIELGYAGTGTQPNLTTLGNGKNGTVTGATVADHVPILPVFRRTASGILVPVTSVVNATVNAVVATKNRSLLAPVVSGSGSATVSAVVATKNRSLLAPGVSGSSSVTSPALTVSRSMLAPSFTRTASVTAVPGIINRSMLAPSVSTALGGIKTLIATDVSQPARGTAPGPDVYPGSDLYPEGYVLGILTLGATGYQLLDSTVPAADNYPGADTYPGSGTNVGSTPYTPLALIGSRY